MLHLMYFSNSELCRVTHPAEGIVLTEENVQSFYNPELLQRLDDMRRRARIPILLNSGYRCLSYNAKVGGSKDSSHTKGLAMDISCTDSEHRFYYLRAALAAGFTRIGIGLTFLHLDIDPDKPQNCIWHY